MNLNFCYKLFIAIGLVLLSGCVTQPDTATTPSQNQLATLRVDARTALQKSTEALNKAEDSSNQILEYSTRISNLEKIIEEQKRTIEQLRADRAATSSKIIDELVNSVNAANRSNVNDIARVNTNMQGLITKMKDIQGENVRFQESVATDLSKFQNDLKNLRDRVNENTTKIAALSKTPTTSTTTAPKTSPTAEKITRTGKPSKPTIDYSQLYEHIVESGESLSLIARLYDVSVDDIYNVNQNLTSSSIRVGQKLVIPANTKKN